jgi:hypothetical protein
MILLPIIDDLALARPKQQYIWLTIFGQELLQKTKLFFQLFQLPWRTVRINKLTRTILVNSGLSDSGHRWGSKTGLRSFWWVFWVNYCTRSSQEKKDWLIVIIKI